jgi:hypothetical protein
MTASAPADRFRGDRIAALLLLPYAAWRATFLTGGAISNGVDEWLVEPILLVAAIAVASVGAWQGRRWARGWGVGLGFLVGGELFLISAVDVLWPSAYGGRINALPPLILASASAAAAIRLVRGWTREDGFRDATGVAAASIAMAGALMLAIVVFGLGGLRSLWYQEALAATQAPAAILLRGMGYCCGYDNEVVISDKIDDHWGGITRIGIPMLLVANAVGLIPFVLLARSIRRRISRGPLPHPARATKS